MEMEIVVLGINYKTAPVEVREKLSFTEKELEKALVFSREVSGLQETVIISTCNRTEVYAVVKGFLNPGSMVVNFLSRFKEIEEEKLKECFYVYRGMEAICHLFKVTAGLDSMVLGETQILGQVKDAYYKSIDVDRVDTILHALFRQAVTVGKRVHRETEINDHAASVSYVAVGLAQKIFKVLSKRRVMVVGAGEMAQLTLKHLCDEGVKDLVIVNRSREQAHKLAEMFGGRVVNYDHLIDVMYETDIVISSTGAPHFILNEEKVKKVMEGRRGKEVFLIDIAVPRDVDPLVGSIEGVHLYNIDDLQAVVEANMRERKLAAKKAEKIINREAHNFQTWLDTRMVVPLISALKDKAEQIRQEQLNRALEKLKNLNDKEKKAVENLSRNIINNLLREPVLRLKEAAGRENTEDYLLYLSELFALDLDLKRDDKIENSKN